MIGIVNDLIEFLQDYDEESNYVMLDILPLTNKRRIYSPIHLKYTRPQEAFL